MLISSLSSQRSYGMVGAGRFLPAAVVVGYVLQFALFVLSISCLVMNAHNPFIYFNFCPHSLPGFPTSPLHKFPFYGIIHVPNDAATI